MRASRGRHECRGNHHVSRHKNRKPGFTSTQGLYVSEKTWRNLGQNPMMPRRTEAFRRLTIKPENLKNGTQTSNYQKISIQVEKSRRHDEDTKTHLSVWKRSLLTLNRPNQGKKQLETLDRQGMVGVLKAIVYFWLSMFILLVAFSEIRVAFLGNKSSNRC